MSEVKKAEVEIEKPKTEQEKIQESLEKLMEMTVEPPEISDTLEKARLAIDQAQKAKQKPQRQTWYCTDCGSAHIQIHAGGGHFPVDVMEGEFVDKAGNPLNAEELHTMKHYALPKVKHEEDYGAKNSQTVAQMKYKP